MGFAKDQLLREEAQRQEAIKIAVDAGVLKRCPYHEDVVLDTLGGDNVPAYKLGNYRLSQGELNGVFSSPREMTDAIAAAVKDSGMECGFCAKD
jgi:hypothetical protein